ncbi:MAG: hypothetical protein MJZ82_04065 [Paludibacteraceae bacterium]|nr:hypothetical protein [Paludibacteraceae bacterium]
MDSIAAKISHFEEFVSMIQETPTSPAEWLKTWSIYDWQRVEYMPNEDIYWFTQGRYMLTISQDGTDCVVQAGPSTIVRAPWPSTNHISIPQQEIPDIDGATEIVEGDVYLVNDTVYLYLSMIGSQDFSAKSYGCNYEDFDANVTDFPDTAIPELPIRMPSYKVIEDGQLVIIKNGIQYNAIGAKIQ